MGQDLFSVPIFFIVLRETIEAAIIVSVLLSFVEQLMRTGRLDGSSPSPSSTGSGSAESLDDIKRTQKLIKRMRIQIWAGTLTGFFIALSIGAGFIAVFYTKVTDLWGKTEELWEGTFSIIACILIYIMGIAFLKMDRSRVKWRIKLADAFEKSHSRAISAQNGASLSETEEARRGEGKSGKWALFILPFITVLREGLEAVVFVGGVSLNQPGKSIPIPAIVGLLAGGLIGYFIYRTGSTSTLHWFLIGSTTILFLIGAGLASKGVGLFEYYVFARGVGGDVAETGDGPGSFQVKGNVWHLTYGSPEPGSPGTNGGYQLFNAVLGWTNTATLGSILSYVFYWLLIIVTLIYLKWKEGRFAFFGYASKAGQNRLNGQTGSGDRKGYRTTVSPSDAEMEDLDQKKDVGESPGTEDRIPILEH
ncbi:iron permease FTR1/Fip1/EfeU [Kockovaella imperatae]|uniref:Iron permease FTR1/Fip1/EfeU n=1 Tax=Kockovaella imperatae TaxID=4999 RepID=A0A1Y1UJN4_9TREE|nr:iron permease FTR1/Fip1/EfeU [Kockovaella imperatae]ORX37335.1 iron permease FTR1/Fip1/EfeU [Kockovaella imperatae]